jgi:hypothetical protein
MIKNGELIVPSRKRGINLPTREELLAKLTDMYENVKQVRVQTGKGVHTLSQISSYCHALRTL